METMLQEGNMSMSEGVDDSMFEGVVSDLEYSKYFIYFPYISCCGLVYTYFIHDEKDWARLKM